MGLGPSIRSRGSAAPASGPIAGLFLLLVLGLTACVAPPADDDAEALGSSQLAATTPKLRASKWVKLWSDLKMDRASQAHYRACAGQPFKFTLTFRNKGSAVWRDVVGRGNKVGSDVFVETANGKKDRLTGRKRFSLRANGNDWVRGDRKAKECTMKRGCRRTRAIYDGIDAVAPVHPGIYKSRWRLRDYSKAWDKPQGFGPKVEMRLRVEQCAPAPDGCGCSVECSDGTTTKLWSTLDTDAMCKTVGETFCLPAEYVSHEFVPCPDPSDAGTGQDAGPGEDAGSATSDGGSPAPVPDGGPNAEEPPEQPGWWITDEESATGGSGGSGGSGSGGSGGVGASSGSGGFSGGGSPWPGDEDDPGIGTDVPDDPDYQPDGFDGVVEDVSPGVVSEESGCSLSAHEGRTSPLALALLIALGALRRRRSVQKAI